MLKSNTSVNVDYKVITKVRQEKLKNWKINILKLLENQFELRFVHTVCASVNSSFAGCAIIAVYETKKPDDRYYTQNGIYRYRLFAVYP